MHRWSPGPRNALGVPVATQLTGWNPQALYAAVEAGHRCSSGRLSTTRHRPPAPGPHGMGGRSLDGGGPRRGADGRQHSAGTLEFSDPLTGSYNGTTMAQFARTFTIYGAWPSSSSASRTPHHPTSPFGTWSSRSYALPVVVRTSPTATPAPWVPTRRVRIPSAFDGGDGVGVAAASLGLLTGVAAASPQPSGAAFRCSSRS